MRSCKQVFQVALCIFSILMASVPESVWAGPGSCQDFDFPRNPDNEIDRVHPVKIIKQGTRVYKEAKSTVPRDEIFLEFDKALAVMDASERRVLVRFLTSLDPLGWVERQDLLCTISPLKSKRSGLEQKLYIKTATEVREDKPATVKAYLTPNLQGCADDCQELSRFTGYFVIDEEEDSYLLSDSYRLDETTRLLGWVSKENGFIWDTAYGIRPAEDLLYPAGHPLEGQEKAICAYASLDDAHAEKNCQPILGGERWYRYPLRIPILDRIEKDGHDFYKVVLPLAGIGVDKVIEPGQFAENRGIEALLDMKQIDVLFLIDGTKSLKQHIEQIRGTPDGVQEGVVQQIMNALQEDEAFRETQFRFGFRIYRDAFAGEKELGQGMPITGACTQDKEEQKENLRRFQQALQEVEVSEETQDDHPENLFGGIVQAVRDLAHCPDRNHTRILFIIGDCGYDAEAQEQRGRTPIQLDEIIERLKGEKNIVTFFLQAPLTKESVADRKAYERAYNVFTHQAEEVLDALLAEDVDNEKSRYIATTDDVTLNRRIIAGIKGFSNADLINEVVLDLRGGTALVDAVQRLQGSPKYHNIPGLFWEQLQQGSCAQLGEQCRERVYDTILEGYIPISDEIVEDVWMKSSDLDNWTMILRGVETSLLSSLKGAELREAFVLMLRDALERVVRKPSYKDSGEALEVYLQRKGGLPVRDASPLFSYSLADLKDPRTVPNCEIGRLAGWVNSVRQMLSIIYHGDLRPVANIEPFPGECPSGDAIPFINGDVESRALSNDPAARYNHSFQKAHVYWVPKEFLP